MWIGKVHSYVDMRVMKEFVGREEELEEPIVEVVEDNEDTYQSIFVEQVEISDHRDIRDQWE